MADLVYNEADVVTPNDGGQAAFWDDWHHRFVALEGGMGAGKTYIGSRKLLTLHLYNAFDDDHRPTMVPSCVIAPTYENAMDFDVPAILDAAEEFGLPRDWRMSRKQIVFPGAPLAPIMCRTADKAQRIAGFEVGAFWGDEAARWKEDRDNPMNDPLIQIMGRLRHPKARIQQGFYTYTNEGDHTSIYEEFHSGAKDHAIYRATTYENEANVGQFITSQESNLTAELAKQYLMGDAITLRGTLAYGTFDRHIHVDAGVDLVPDLPLCLFMDFNIDPGMSGGLGQYDERADRFTAVHEYHAAHMTVVHMVNAMAATVREYGGWDAWPEVWVFGDPAGRQRSASTGDSDYAVLFQALDAAGCPMELVRKRWRHKHAPVTDRVNAVNVAFVDMRGEGHAVIHPRCARLINDFEKVRRSDDGRDLDKRNKQLTHASDGWGYFVEYLRPVRALHTNKNDGRFAFAS